MRKIRLISAMAAAAFLFVHSCISGDGKTTKINGEQIGSSARVGPEELVAKGKHLLTIGGCNDCHTPKKFGPHGISLDSSRMFSGHPAGSPLPPVNRKSLEPGQWLSMAPDITAFVGPWGISFAANLTPDSSTGIGAWSEQRFVRALKTGKHMGLDQGRNILPPMPWENLAAASEDDLKAMYAYLRSLPPVSNKVPDPVPPAEVR